MCSHAGIHIVFVQFVAAHALHVCTELQSRFYFMLSQYFFEKILAQHDLGVLQDVL